MLVIGQSSNSDINNHTLSVTKSTDPKTFETVRVTVVPQQKLKMANINKTIFSYIHNVI